MILPFLAAAGAMAVLSPSSPPNYEYMLEKAARRVGGAQNLDKYEIVLAKNGLYQLRNKNTGILQGTWTGNDWLQYYGMMPLDAHGSAGYLYPEWRQHGQKVRRIQKKV